MQQASYRGLAALVLALFLAAGCQTAQDGASSAGPTATSPSHSDSAPAAAATPGSSATTAPPATTGTVGAGVGPATPPPPSAAQREADTDGSGGPAHPSATATPAANPTALPVHCLPDRWMYVTRGLKDDKEVDDVADLVTRGAAHGINGMVFDAKLDQLDLQNAEFFARLAKIKAVCEKNKGEMIPLLFAAGYGNAVQHHDRNLAEGFAIVDMPMLAGKGEAQLAADPDLKLPNPGLEIFKNNAPEGWSLRGKAGETAFEDTKVFHGGKASIRFEHFEKMSAGQAGLMHKMAVTPNRSYVLSFWIKTENLDSPATIEIEAVAGDDEDKDMIILHDRPALTATQDWTECKFQFNSMAAKEIALYIGGNKFKTGTFWLDDCQLVESGLLNVLHRPGAPVTVVGAKSGVTYAEGKDYAPVVDAKLSFKPDHDPLPLKLLPGSAIQEGEALKVSFYTGMRLRKGQVSICMSEPKVYEIWTANAKLIQEKLGAKTFMLDMDEIRECGTCKACSDRHISQAELLGDCITKQVAILRQSAPGCRVFCWSDMLDPNHNCRDHYYLTAGDYTGAWKYVPKDLGICCWYGSKMEPSLKHFSELGHPLVAMAYYDADTLGNSAAWNDALKKTSGGIGICYTTWDNKYKLLEEFGDLVSK